VRREPLGEIFAKQHDSHHARRWGLASKPDEYRSMDLTARSANCGKFGGKVPGSARFSSACDPEPLPRGNK
jgi:hypothetical protein